MGLSYDHGVTTTYQKTVILRRASFACNFCLYFNSIHFLIFVFWFDLIKSSTNTVLAPALDPEITDTSSEEIKSEPENKNNDESYSDKFVVRMDIYNLYQILL